MRHTMLQLAGLIYPHKDTVSPILVRYVTTAAGRYMRGEITWDALDTSYCVLSLWAIEKGLI